MAADPRFPNGTHKAQVQRNQEKVKEKKQTPVVSGEVKRTGKKSNFLSEDFRDVKNYVVSDVIVPAAKNTIVDIVTKGINMLIYGEDRSPSRRSSGTRFNYNGLSSSRYDDRDIRPARRSTYDYDNLIYDTQGDAENVFEGMCDILDSCGSVSIGEMYDLSREQTISTDFDWGWTNLSTAKVAHVRDGWIIDLPRPQALGRR